MQHYDRVSHGRRADRPLRREKPAFIKEEDRHKWPETGPMADQCGYIPEGFTAAQVLDGSCGEALAKEEAKRIEALEAWVAENTPQDVVLAKVPARKGK